MALTLPRGQHGAPATATPAVEGKRPDIQGLRAVAVLLVLGYHLFPHRISGGYVGVDFFFVISGFLITSHLVREVESTGRVSLTGFWARRLRRLMPASLLVLATSVALARFVLPTTLWDQTLRQITASALYAQNWVLAGDAVSYSAEGNTPTVVQHYWSLAVEEQFYVVWPLLVLGVAFGCRQKPHVVRRALLVSIGLVCAASFAYSVVHTAADPGAAYFVTTTRIWELGAGALVAVLRPTVPRAAGAVGLVAVTTAALLYDAGTPFPGWTAALPVLAAAALVAPTAANAPAARLLAVRPLTFVGDISYAVYLWHWPLLVALPYATGHPLTTAERLGVVVATIGVSWLTTRWVEAPVRVSRPLSAHTWLIYACAATGIVAVLVPVHLVQRDLDRRVTDAEDRAAATVAARSQEPCLGPAALADDCSSPTGQAPFLVPPEVVARENTGAPYPGCIAALRSPEVRGCQRGATTRPRRTVALVGDSHATHWLGALDRIGREHGWKIVSYGRESCPFNLEPRISRRDDATSQDLCVRSNETVLRRLVADDAIDMVLVSGFSSRYTWASDPAAGYRSIWKTLQEAGKDVAVLRDVPLVKDRVNAPDCLAEHSPLDCSLPRSEALGPDTQVDAARAAGVGVVDLSDLFCDERRCYPVVGDVIVYRDFSHLSKEYATMLAPYLYAALDEPRP